MRNRAMLLKLVSGDTINVSECERTPDGDYVLPERLWDKIRGKARDVADGMEEYWICSIGRRKTDKVILASQTNKFYQNPDFDCLWLR